MTREWWEDEERTPTNVDRILGDGGPLDYNVAPYRYEDGRRVLDGPRMEAYKVELDVSKWVWVLLFVVGAAMLISWEW